MSELTIKELAPYLPYKLEMELLDFPLGKHIRTLELDCGHDFHFYLQQNKVKPLLHPLSSLTKEIEHNGERFVPNNHKDFKMFIKEDLEYFISNIKYAPYNMIQQLAEWHIDFQDLIGQGKALNKQDYEQV